MTINHQPPPDPVVSHAPAWPRTIWFTGLSAAGKTTLGTLLAAELRRLGRPAHLLDGDAVRTGLCADLGYSPADRRENLRRVAHLARTLNDADITVVACFISPHAADRQMVRDLLAPHPFLEIYLDTPLAVCESRDPKGHYLRARQSQLPHFTGVSAPYEPPLSPALVLSPHREPPAACLRRILDVLGV